MLAVLTVLFHCVSKTNRIVAKVAQLSREIRSLRQDAEGLNNPDTFVKSAKLQRSANAKEKEVSELKQELHSLDRTGCLMWISMLRVRPPFLDMSCSSQIHKHAVRLPRSRFPSEHLHKQPGL